jgi:hypothetical protein
LVVVGRPLALPRHRTTSDWHLQQLSPDWRSRKTMEENVRVPPTLGPAADLIRR